METFQTIFDEFVALKGLELVSIIVIVALGRIILKRVAKKIVGMMSDEDDTSQSSKEKRAETLVNVGTKSGNIVIYIVAFLMFMDTIGLDIRPILAGVGVLGLAVGFGAQSLVKDFVSGLFILVENQYGVGDKVKIGASEGTVIRITMRSTVLRDEEGNIYFIANGTINSAINYSRK